MCRTLPEASWLALDPRSGAATDCQVLSTLRGEICGILRAVEASQREGGERIARLGREGRIRRSVCLQCVRDDGGCEKGAKSEKRLLSDKAPHEPLEEPVGVESSGAG